MQQEKVTDIATAAGMVSDGDLVAIQGMGTQTAPVALVRELIRAGRRNLGVVSLIGGIAVDWLATAGAMDRFVGAAVTLEQFGMCTQYRRGVERGRIRVAELSETALNAGLGAAARGLPFLPTRGLIGTDLIDALPDQLRVIEDPFGSGTRVVACRALQPDVALIHAHRADRFGNVALDPTVRWPDLSIMPQASDKVVVSVEEIVDTEVLREHPERTILPGFAVDAVVEVRHGARPTSLYPRYGYDAAFLQAWAEAARDDERALPFLQQYVLEPENFAAALDLIGELGKESAIG